MPIKEEIRKKEKKKKALLWKNHNKGNFHCDLKEFRLTFPTIKTPKERIYYLLGYSKKFYYKVSGEELEKRRQKFRKRLKMNTVVRYNNIIATCKVCKTNQAEHRHHIIQLHNGGPPLGRSNLIALCVSCHAKIHPWL